MVLLIHGLLDSSDAWVINGREKSIAFLLTDHGYDVWMANFRGNPYSEQHAFLDSEIDIEYWKNCTVNDMADYDLPAFTSYIKSKTGVEKLSLIAHSQSN